MIRSAHVSEERVYRQDTLDAYERGVHRAIGAMRARLGEALTMDELASAAFMSRYHFTRTFAQITGVSPGRFLTSLRLQEAKRLLLKTDRSVTDISLDVGYNSLGTFTRIFTDFVGFSPNRFRQLALPILHVRLNQAQRLYFARSDTFCNGTLRGTIACNLELEVVAVALFSGSIPRCPPKECALLFGSANFSFKNRHHRGDRLFAAGILDATIEDALLFDPEKVFVGMVPLLEESRPATVLLELRRQRLIDAPVLVAFPLVIVETLFSTGIRLLSAL